MISKARIGSFCAILSGFLYGFVGYFGVNAIHASLSPSNMLFWRFLIASTVMIFICFTQKTKPTDTKASLFIAFLSGAAFYAFSTLLYFLACPYIGSGLSMVILFTYPAMVIFLNHFIYGARIQTSYYIAVPIIFLGLFFFVDMHEMHFDLWGILLSILSAFLYAIYIFSSKKVAFLSPYYSTLMVSLGCMTTSLINAWIEGSFSVPNTSTAWLNLLGIGILSSAVPILLLQYSLNYISSEKASILSVLEPIFVLFLGVWLLGEPMKLQYALGVVIVLSGALVILFSDKKEEKVGR